jgi:hypothetical protein
MRHWSLGVGIWQVYTKAFCCILLFFPDSNFFAFGEGGGFNLQPPIKLLHFIWMRKQHPGLAKVSSHFIHIWFVTFIYLKINKLLPSVSTYPHTLKYILFLLMMWEEYQMCIISLFYLSWNIASYHILLFHSQM